MTANINKYNTTGKEETAMKAKKINGQAVNGKREMLASKLPLDTPYSITIFPIYACNFRCKYCLHSLEKDEREFISDTITMPWETYKKCIDDILKFPHKVKMLHLSGLGEPLLHKDIGKMVAYANQKGVAEGIDIVTNGSMLTKELTHELVDAGLTVLRISLQGINEEQYKREAGIDIDFDEFYNNIKYFYDNRGNTKLYIKVIDEILDDGQQEEFFNMFGDICDIIAIEHLCPFVDKINYTDTFNQNEFYVTMNGNQVPNTNICPQPFYSLQIYPDGKCIPCCTVEKPIVVGDCLKQSLVQIWNGDVMNSFRRLQLQSKKENNRVCAKCQQYKYGMFKEDILDEYASDLLKLYQ